MSKHTLDGQAANSVVGDIKIYLNSALITEYVSKVTLHESIYMPFIKGTIDMEDWGGLLDNYIRSDKDTITITVSVNGTHTRQDFYLDGVSNVNTEKIQSHKTYILNLKSLNALNNAVIKISKKYEGTSSEVIEQIYKEFGEKGLWVRSEGHTRGKYIAPNISPLKAIGQILANTYDENNSPMFIFESFFGYGSSDANLISYERMANSTPFYDVSLFLPEQNDQRIIYGAPNKVVILSDHDNELFRTESGIKGQEIIMANLSKSNIEVKSVGKTDLQATKSVVPYFKASNENHLIDPEDAPRIWEANVQRAKMSSVIIGIYGCRVMPGLRAGNTVTFNLPEGTKQYGDSQTDKKSVKHSGKFLVSEITHRITSEGYEQDLIIIRDDDLGKVKPYKDMTVGLSLHTEANF